VTLELILDGTRYTCALATEPEPEPVERPAVVAYSQNDPRWRAQIYAGGTTFGKAGCLVVSVAMIASLVYPEPLDPPTVAAALRAVGAFDGALLSKPARIHDALDRLTWGGVLHWRAQPADLNILRREIDTYGATICEVKWNPSGASPEAGNQHFIVVDGLDGDDALIVDPWDGKRKRLSASSYRLPGWNVARTLYGLRMVRANG